MTASDEHSAHRVCSLARTTLQRQVSLRWAAACTCLAIAVTHSTVSAQVESAAPPADSAVRPEIVSCRIGFDGAYKLGFWTPVWIDIRGVSQLAHGQLELVCPDYDGIPTAVRVAIGDPEASKPGTSHSVLVYTKFGKMDEVVTVRILNGDAIVATRDFSASVPFGEASIPTALPALSELFLQIGSGDISLTDALSSRDSEGRELPRRVAQVADVGQLPHEWYGYEAVDCLIMSLGSTDLLVGLSSTDTPMVAVRRWVEMGGRLVLFCGASAADLMRPAGAISDLVPGKLADMVTLDETDALEVYSETEIAVLAIGEKVEFRAPRLTDVRGRIEAYEGNQPTALPLVVRAPLGFGEVVFAAVDLSQEPFNAWPDRHQLVKKLLRVPDLPTGTGVARSQALTTRGYNDLAAALRQRLGSRFLGITLLPFGLVAAAIVAYLFLIGPIDYYLVKNVLKRMEWTWVTFPAIVLLVCGGAFWYTGRTKGRQLRTNFAEIVDIDLVNGQARGTAWASVYSPHATTYNLSLRPRWPSKEAVTAPHTLLSWMGRPGSGLGGMQAGSGLGSFGSEYRVHLQPGSLERLPIQVWSTKTVAGRWSAPAANLVHADLIATGDGLVEGQLRNTSGAELVDARLLFGRWAWRLGDLGDSQTITVDDRHDPVKVTTLLTSRVRTALPARTASGLREVFVPEQASIEQLLDLLSFYDAVGGYGFTRLWNRLQPYCDLSHLLEHDRAILMAHCQGPRSELLYNDQSIGTNNDQNWTLYRFVLPVSIDP